MHEARHIPSSNRLRRRVGEKMVRLVKHGIRSFVRSRAFHPLASLIAACDTRRPNTRRVLTYHRIGCESDAPHLNPVTLSASPEAFEQHLQLLVDRFHVVSIEEVLAAFHGQFELPPQSVLITFDDAYTDFATVAWPILRHFDMPALLFVPTAFPVNSQLAFWWDDLYRCVYCREDAVSIETAVGQFPITTARQKATALTAISDHFESLPVGESESFVKGLVDKNDIRAANESVMGWDQIRALVDQGLGVGVHTRTHPILPNMSASDARSEIVHARDDLRREVSNVANVFAYPGGAFRNEAVEILRDADFELAFTTCRGANVIGACDRFRLRRINIGRATTNAVLNAQLTLNPKWFNRFCRMASD